MTKMDTNWKVRLMEVLSVGCRGGLAVVFIYACIHKIATPADFALQVATYQILPLGLVNLQAIVLPWLELVTGLLLIAGFWTRPAALVTCGMNVMFIIAIAMALSAELHLQCGCFASSDAGEEMTVALIIRDAGLLIAGAYLVWMRPDRLTVDRWLAKRHRHAP